jgi:predicted RecB family nuclease
MAPGLGRTTACGCRSSPFGLKEVSSYLRFHPSTDVTSGLDTVMLYHAWLASKDEAIRAQLTVYNRDDIDVLAHTISRIRNLAPTRCRPGDDAAR